MEAAAKADEDTATKADMAGLKADFTVLKADFAAFESRLTVRIIAAQVATATLLFAALRWFG